MKLKSVLLVLLGAACTGLLGATVYNQFSPGGALSGTWNSQNVNVAAGAPFITGALPVANETPAGSDTQVQLNSGGALSASANLTFNPATSTLGIAGSHGTAGNVLTSGGTGAAAWGTVNLASANAVTNTLPTPSGGTGLATLTTHGVLLGEGTGNMGSVAAMAADTLLQGQGTGADPAAVSVNNCGSSTQALSYSTSTHAFGCQTITGAATPAGATGNVQYNNAGAFGGVANGSAGNALLSNGASAPSWGVPAQLTVTQSVANANIPPVLANGTTMNYAAGVTVNPSTATVTATTFSGTATTATVANGLNVTVSGTNANYAIVLANGTVPLYGASILANPGTGAISAVSVGATTFTGALSGNATTATTAVNLSGGAVTTSNGALLSGGTKFTASGCSNSATVGGAIAGQFASGTTGTCTVTITLPTAPNGWACRANDITTPALMNQTAKTTTSCTISGTTTTSDVVVFLAMGY